MIKRYGLFLLFLVLACQPIEHSVFKAVIEARPEVDYSLDNNLTIIGMADDGTDYFLATATSLWMRAISLNTSSNVTWDNVTKPAGADLCTAFAYTGANIYAGFKFTNNTYNLYMGAFGTSPGWNKVTDANVAGKQIVRLWYLDGSLFALVFSGSTFTLYYYDSVNFVATGISGLAYPVTSMCSNGTDYWAVTRNRLYRSQTAPDNFLAFDPAPTKGTSDAYTGIFYSTTYSSYYLSLNNGRIYSTTDPTGGWPVNSGVEEDNTRRIYFNEPAEIDSNIIAGTMQNGFFETRNGDITKIARYENELISDINYSSILGFYVHAGENLVFILTGGYGLYRIGYTLADGWSDLIHE